MRDLRELDLNDEQKQQLHDLMEAKHSQLKGLMREQREGKKALREATIAEPYDAARVEELAAKQGQRMADLLVRRATTQRQIRALLTPDQLAELDDLRARRDCRGKDD